MMVDDFRLRSLQTLVDWLDAICDLIEERIRRTSETASADRLMASLLRLDSVSQVPTGAGRASCASCATFRSMSTRAS